MQANPRVGIKGSSNSTHASTSNTHGALTKATYSTATQNSVSSHQHLLSANAHTTATISGLNNITQPSSNQTQYVQMKGQGIVVK